MLSKYIFVDLAKQKSETDMGIVNMKLNAQLGEFVVVVASVKGEVAKLHMKRKYFID